jgi:hypothetical protein
MERDHYPVWQRRQMARLAAQGATIDCNLDGFRVRRGQHSVWCPRDPRHFCSHLSDTFLILPQYHFI